MDIVPFVDLYEITCCVRSKRIAALPPKPDLAKVKFGEPIQLLNGKDLTGWTPKIRGEKLGDNYGDTFRVENGVLKVAYDPAKYPTFGEKFGHLFFAEPFSRYKLRVEYRFVGEQCPGGPGWAVRNSGVMLHGEDPAGMTLDQDFPASIEVQFLQRLRGDTKFPSGADLSRQIAVDVERAKAILREHRSALPAG